MKILSFGTDTSLLSPDDPANAGQYRQRRYCERLDQSKTFIILGANESVRERVLAEGRLRAFGVGAGLRGLIRGYQMGVRVGRQFQPDVVEYQDPKALGVIAYAAARALRIPLVGGVFNDLLDNPAWLGGSARRRLLNGLGKWVLARSSAVRCDSAEATSALHRQGYDRVDYIPFFIPWIERFAVPEAAVTARLTQWDADPIVLCAARLVAGKNIPLLLNAFATLPRGRLIITGSGPLKDSLPQQAAELGIADRMMWAGFVDFETLISYFHSANLFVLPSDAETSARVLIQAQAARLPTVTTATSGSRAIVSEGRSGYVTPVGDAAALADALRGVVADRALYQRMLSSPDYYDCARHSEAMVMPRLKEFYQIALKS